MNGYRKTSKCVLFETQKTCRLFKVSVTLPPSGKISAGAHEPNRPRCASWETFCSFLPKIVEIDIAEVGKKTSKLALCGRTILQLYYAFYIYCISLHDVGTRRLTYTLERRSQVNVRSLGWQFSVRYVYDCASQSQLQGIATSKNAEKSAKSVIYTYYLPERQVYVHYIHTQSFALRYN